MTKERIISAFWACLMAFVLSVGGIGCLVTAFDLNMVDMEAIALFCLCASLLWAVAGLFRHGIMVGWSVSGLLVIGDWLLGSENLIQFRRSLENLVHRISQTYDQGYHWGVIQWSENLPSTTPDVALCVIAFLIIFAVVWCVCRRQSAILAVLGSLLPLFACLVLNDTVPDTIYLMLLLGGLVLLIMTNSLRRRDLLQANRLTAMLLLPVLLGNMVLFWAVPRSGYEPHQIDIRFFQTWGDYLLGISQSNTVGGMDDQVQLDNLSYRVESYSTAMWVSTQVTDSLYLRGRSYDFYDGHSWTDSGKHTGQKLLAQGAIVADNGSVTIETPEPLDYYYVPSPPGREGQELGLEKGQVRNENKETLYAFKLGTVQNGGWLTEAQKQQYLQLPAYTAAAVRELFQEGWWGEIYPKNQDDMVKAIANLVRQTADYSLYPSAMPEGEEDFALWFMNEGEQGYCVHFATAATVLLRARGIPARYVTGYLVEAKAGRRVAVPQKQAHAWVEYFDDETGWTVLEATPGVGEEEPAPGPTEATTAPTEATTQPTDPSTEPTETTEETTAPTEETTLPGSTESQAATDPSETTGEPQGNFWNIESFLWIFWVILAGIGVWVQYRVRLWLHRRYLKNGTPNQRALRLWKWTRWRGRLAKEMPTERLRELTEKAKFSQHILTDEELEEYIRHLSLLSEKLKKKPIFIRWLLRLIFATE